MHRLSLIKTLTILSSVCCSSCSADPRSQYADYYELLTTKEAPTVIVWLDNEGTWNSCVVKYLNFFPIEKVAYCQKKNPCPLRTMGELVELSGVTPSEVSVEEVPYPIEDYDIGSALDRWCLKPWVLKQLNLYEEWRFSLWVPCA